MNDPVLSLARDERDLIASHHNFVREVKSQRALATDVARRSRFWVYDPPTQTFSPSKFTGYTAMDFARYQLARLEQHTGVKFDGGLTQRAIATILGGFASNPDLMHRLTTWVESVLGPDSLDGVDSSKWQFATLRGSAGLVSLAGGWDDSGELVDTLADLRRTPGRKLPED